MEFLKYVQSEPIYRATTLREVHTRKHVGCLNVWRLHSKYTKEEHITKPPWDKLATMSVSVVKIREWNLPCQPTLRMAALASARQIMQAIQVMIWPVQKNTWLVHVPGHSTNECITLKVMLHSAYTKRNNPALVKIKSVVRPSSLTAVRKRWTPWYPMMHPS